MMEKWTNHCTVCKVCIVYKYVICHSCKVLEKHLEDACKVLEFDFGKKPGTLYVKGNYARLHIAEQESSVWPPQAEKSHSRWQQILTVGSLNKGKIRTRSKEPTRYIWLVCQHCVCQKIFLNSRNVSQLLQIYIREKPTGQVPRFSHILSVCPCGWEDHCELLQVERGRPLCQTAKGTTL